MDAEAVLQIAQEALLLVLLISGPAVLVALVVGLGVALFQAASQLQDHALPTVPKIIAVYVVLLITGFFVIRELATFAITLYERFPQVAQ